CGEIEPGPPGTGSDPPVGSAGPDDPPDDPPEGPDAPHGRPAARPRPEGPTRTGGSSPRAEAIAAAIGVSRSVNGVANGPRCCPAGWANAYDPPASSTGPPGGVPRLPAAQATAATPAAVAAPTVRSVRCEPATAVRIRSGHAAMPGPNTLDRRR